ncbi:O-antigen ligase family protein [Microbacterium testaceum]|uniref:O-antigen ligase family protein n=1 Tax=Microbacterium testaceum TaxID=2033 RepID=UPI002AC39894|nr:O-antigen ligase family protein [Microbacterium testaceum]MDZ5146131.1 O-antigen ligase family protein [Microbacterium testaceum]
MSETLTTNRQFYVEGAESAAVGSVTTTYAAVNIGVPVIAVAIVVAVALFKRIDLVPIGVVALPSLTLSALQFISGRELSAALLVPALIGASVVALGIRIDDLAVIGYLGGAVAVVSMIGMAVAPQSVLMSAGLAQAEKSLTGEPLLAGIFSHSNILGMFLGLSLPFAFLVKRWVISAILMVAICSALILTSSRTAVSGALIVLAVALLGWILPRAPWRIIGVVGFVAVVSALFVVPFSETDPAAYTYRGEIWMYNIDQWSQDRLFGLGADWYRDNYRELREILSSAASHAHNEALTLLVQGGAVLLVAVGVLIASAWKGAAQQERRREGITAVSFVLGFLLMSVTETTFPILNWGPTSAVALVPLFVLAADAWGGRNVGSASRARVAEGEDGFVTWRQWVN